MASYNSSDVTDMIRSKRVFLGTYCPPSSSCGGGGGGGESGPQGPTGPAGALPGQSLPVDERSSDSAEDRSSSQCSCYLTFLFVYYFARLSL